MTKKVKEVSADKENGKSKESKQTGVQVDFYTLEYIDKTWNISTRYLREAIKNGSLKAYKVGKPYIVTHSDLIEYVTRVRAKE